MGGRAEDVERAGAPTGIGLGGPPLVLVVEDDPIIRDSVQELLELDGYAVATAADGRQAIDLIAVNSPALILLYMRMPVMDGWQFAATYRLMPGDHAPIVVMTAAHDAEERAAAIAADGVLPKPFDADVLLELVASRLAVR